MSDYLPNEDFLRFRRFHYEQMKKMGIEVARISQSLKDVGALKPIGQPVRELLTKQVEKLSKRIMFLEQRVLELTRIQNEEQNNEQPPRTNSSSRQTGVFHIPTRPK